MVGLTLTLTVTFHSQNTSDKHPYTGQVDVCSAFDCFYFLIDLSAYKTGLALINGTQFMAALGAEAIERAKRIALQADVAAALTLEALQGTSRAFDEAIHSARPHPGQQAVAARLRKLLKYGSEMSEITGCVLFYFVCIFYSEKTLTSSIF